MIKNSQKHKKKIRALLLFSGGLDSMLTAELLRRNNIDVIGITFVTPFFVGKQAETSAKKIKLKLIKIDFTDEYLDLLKNPRYGYGKNMNPCIDCHTFMVKKAKSLLKKYKAQFLATGEVLGERPFSQNKNSLGLVAKNSKADRLLLRPLSAKLLDETIPEEKGWLKKENLLGISGRSRKTQMKLAKKWGIKDYPTPASGCLLTDPGYSQRLRELMSKTKKLNKNDLEIIKFGRIFWFGDVLVLIGRNHEDNVALKKLIQKNDILMKAKDFAGPQTLIRNFSKKKIAENIIKKAAEMTAWYGKGKKEKQVDIIYFSSLSSDSSSVASAKLEVSAKLDSSQKLISVQPKLK